mgnify:CR=1 FL=1|jgi:hypothetical protein
MIEDLGLYYLYRHIRLDTNEVFYIGIGKKLSNFKQIKTEYYRAYGNKLRNDFWKRITKKSNYRVEILLESNDKDFIKSKEKEFIKIYGKRKDGGTLCNLTNGGDGCNGFIPTKEQILKMKICQSKYKIPILCLNFDGSIYKEFAGLADASKELSITRQNIRKICKHYKTIKQEVNYKLKNFIFCYKNDYDSNKYYRKGTKNREHCLKMSKYIAERRKIKKLNKQK